MEIKAVLFDLDGTLLPMDQNVFVGAYMKLLAAKMAAHGYDPELLVKTIWAGTEAMVKNNGDKTNEEVFWDLFASVFGQDARMHEPVFAEFYRIEFQKVQESCGYHQQAAQVITYLKERGIRMTLATNPLFPAIATHSRVRWAGLDPADFEIITTYENARHCKPNLAYYRDILEQMELAPADCLMVGNDVGEDMIAAQLGMQTFLMTDCLINKVDKDITQYPHGSFPELMEYINNLLAQ